MTLKSTIAAMAMATLVVAGCSEIPTTSSSDEAAKPQPSTPANPALAYQGYTTYRGNFYRTVAVMDADGSHQTNLYGTSSPAGTQLWDECWSPGGTSVGFVEYNGNAAAPVASIKALDVSVNGRGVPVAANVRTVHNLPANYGTNGGMAWSSTATMGKIAFGDYSPNNTIRTLWVVPAAGGAPIRVWGSDATYVKEDLSILGHRQTISSATWSPNDERLAAVRLDSAGTPDQFAVSTIMIFNTTDNGNSWTYTDSIKVPGTTGMSVNGLDWSRGVNGVDKLVYGNLSDGLIYYVDPITDAVPTTNGVTGRLPNWSPDNTSVLFEVAPAASPRILNLLASFTTTVTTLVQNPASSSWTLVRWKR